MIRACERCAFWEPPPVQPDADKALPMESARKAPPDVWIYGECRYDAPNKNYLVGLDGHQGSGGYNSRDWSIYSSLRQLNRTQASYWCGKFAEKS